MQCKKGISLVGINDIQTVEQIRSDYPDAYFELSYLSTKQNLIDLNPIIKGRIASLHMLCPMREFFPNLASKRAFQWSFDEIMKDAEYAAEHGAENLILHPGYLIDDVVSTDCDIRIKQMEDAKLDQFVSIKKGNICRTDYPNAQKYKDAFKLMIEQALKVSEKVSSLGVNLLIENLNPRAGYLVLLPEELIELAKLGLDLNLDVGHLQICASLFGFNFYDAVDSILKTGKVKSMHLHSNESREGFYVDSHKSFDRYMDAKRVIKMALAANSNMIIESLEEPIHNVSLLFEN